MVNLHIPSNTLDYLFQTEAAHRRSIKPSYAAFDEAVEVAKKRIPVLLEVAMAGARKTAIVKSTGAPDTYEKLVAHVTAPNRELLISPDGSDDTIWDDPDINTRLRALHDLDHVRFGLSFDCVDEIKLGLKESWAFFLPVNGEALRSGVALVVIYEVAGQALYFSVSGGKFLNDQVAFVLDCWRYGLSTAVIKALHREAIV